MTMEGGNINVGGVSFDININLAAFEAALVEAENLAKARAKQIQQVLNPRTGTAAGQPNSTEQTQAVVVRQTRIVIPPPAIVAAPLAPPTITQTQEVVVRQHVTVVPPSQPRQATVTGGQFIVPEGEDPNVVRQEYAGRREQILADRAARIAAGGIRPAPITQSAPPPIHIIDSTNTPELVPQVIQSATEQVPLPPPALPVSVAPVAKQPRARRVKAVQATADSDEQEEPPYTQSLAFARLQAGGVTAQSTPEGLVEDINDPAIQSRLYADHAAQDRIQRREQARAERLQRQRERELTQRYQEGLARSQGAPFTRLSDRAQVGVIPQQLFDEHNAEILRRRAIQTALSGETLSSPPESARTQAAPVQFARTQIGGSVSRAAGLQPLQFPQTGRVRFAGQTPADQQFLAEQAEIRALIQTPPANQQPAQGQVVPITSFQQQNIGSNQAQQQRVRGQQVLAGLQGGGRNAAHIRSLGLPPKLAQAVADGTVSLADAFRANGSGQAAVDALLASVSPAPTAGSNARTAGSGGGGGTAATGTGVAGGGGGGPPRPPRQRQAAGGGGIFGGIFGNTPGAEERTLIRVAAGFIGLNLGINIAAGAARAFHQAIVSSAEASQQLAQSGREIAVAWGSSAQAFTGTGASAFAANPLTKGTVTDYQQTIAALSPLASKYQLTTKQVQDLIIVSGQLARIHGIELSQAMQTVQSVMQGNLEVGGALNLQLVDQYGALRNVGLTYQELSAAIGPAAATQLVFAQVQGETNRQLRNNATAADETVVALDKLRKSADTARSTLTEATKAPYTFIINVAGSFLDWLNAGGPKPMEGWLALKVPPVTAQLPAGAQTPTIPPVPKPVPVPPPAQDNGPSYDLLPKWLRDILGLPQPPKQQPSLTFVGPDQPLLIPPTVLSTPKEPPVPQAPYERGTSYQRETGVSHAEVAGVSAAIATAQARLRQDQAGIQSRIAQSRLDTLTAEADQRRLAVAGSLVELTRERLNLEGQIAPALIRQTVLQNDIARTTQTNYELRRGTLTAQVAAIGPSEALGGVDFRSQQAVLRAQVSMVDAVSGRAPRYDIGQQLGQAYGAAIDRPEAALNNLEAQRAVVLASNKEQLDVMGKQINAIPAMAQLQELRLNEIANIQLAIDVVTAQSAVIERHLQLQTLEEATQARLLAAEGLLTDARLKAAAAAEQIATLQANTPGGFGDTINLTQIIELGGLVVGGDVQAQIDAFKNGVGPATIDAITRAKNSTPIRVPTDTAAGR